MRFNNLEITIKSGEEPAAPVVTGAGGKHLKVVNYQPGIPKKSKQKKWQPPLQQLLDVLKAGVDVKPQAVDPADPASKLAFAAAGADPAISVVEDYGTPLQKSIKLCLECGHLVFPKSLVESVGAERLTSFEEKWNKIAAQYTGGLPYCPNGCTTE